MSGPMRFPHRGQWLTLPELEAALRVEQGPAREIAEAFGCRHADKTGVHEGEHELVTELIWAGAPRGLVDKAHELVCRVEIDAIACFLQNQWRDGWVPVAAPRRPRP